MVTSKPDVPPVVGSKKRKNKLSITHLNKNDEDGTKLNVPQVPKMDEDEAGDDVVLPGDNALLGLATLALVAAREASRDQLQVFDVE